MADYWKSQPRKRCDFCGCWIADNKASIDVHERGKSHKENVERKIAELRKKGHEQYKQQQELAGSLKKIEEEALKKFQQDVASDPALSAKYKALQAKTAAVNATTANTSKIDDSKPLQHEADKTQQNDQEHYPVWYEGTDAEGRVYYWNSVTQESQWEKPADFDGVSAHAYQQDTDNKTETKPESSDSKEEEEEEEEAEEKESKTEDPEDKSEEFNDRRPEKRKASNAYGTWTTVEKEEPVDLELPEDKRVYQEYIPRAAETQPREKLKFKEKTVTSLAGNSSADSTVGFKKRKFGGNVRKRDTTA